MPNQFIVEVYGGEAVRLMEATVANATQIVTDLEDNLNPFIKHIANCRFDQQAEGVAYIRGETLLEAIQDVINLPVGSFSKNLRFMQEGKASEVVEPVLDAGIVTAEIKQETLTLMMVYLQDETEAGKTGLARLIESKVFLDYEWEDTAQWYAKPSAFQPEQLSYLQSFKRRVSVDKPIRFVRSTYIDAAQDWHNISKGKWKNGAKEEHVIRQILSFVHDFLTDSDSRFTLLTVT